MSVIIGLTGQSGAGKSTVCEAFESEGFAVIDCDSVARHVTRPGSQCNRELAGVFPGCFDESFTLDRAKMASVVFADSEKLRLLEDIEYSYITEEIDEQIGKLSKKADYIVLDAPTLFEAGVDKLCSCTVAVISREQLRLERIISRDGISEEQARKRFGSQRTEQFFKEKCGFLIENNGDAAAAKEQAREIAKKIRKIHNATRQHETDG